MWHLIKSNTKGVTVGQRGRVFGGLGLRCGLRPGRFRGCTPCSPYNSEEILLCHYFHLSPNRLLSSRKPFFLIDNCQLVTSPGYLPELLKYMNVG
jgi:hypothetical protein